MFLTIPMWLIAAHYVADFECQNDWMALNKSKDWGVLLGHVTVYATVVWIALIVDLALTGRFMGHANAALAFYGITFVTHFVTDAVTSRWTGRLWFLPQVGQGMRPDWIQVAVKPTRHRFFCAIGLDQLIHYVTLALTLRWLGLLQ